MANWEERILGDRAILELERKERMAVRVFCDRCDAETKEGIACINVNVKIAVGENNSMESYLFNEQLCCPCRVTLSRLLEDFRKLPGHAQDENGKPGERDGDDSKRYAQNALSPPNKARMTASHGIVGG